MVATILTMVTRPPYGCEDAFAGLRFALSQIASGGMDRSDTLLMEDGVYNAVLGQKTDGIGMPSNLEAVEDILALDGRIYVVKEDIADRELAADQLVEGLELIGRAELEDLVTNYEAITTF